MSIEEQTVLMSQLADRVKCPVCYNTLQPPVIQCESGHGVCQNCHRALEKCPICARTFVQFKNRLLEEILELLPHQCKYGCQETVKATDDHEKWCGLQSTGCKLCLWVGFAKDLPNHVNLEHSGTVLLTEDNEIFLSPMSKIEDMFYPMFVFGVFFWVNKKICQQSKMFKITLSLVPNGVMKKNLEVKIALTSDVSRYIVLTLLKIDPSLNPGDKINCLFLHTAILEDYMNEENKMKYQLSVVEIQNKKDG